MRSNGFSATTPSLSIPPRSRCNAAHIMAEHSSEQSKIADVLIHADETLAKLRADLGKLLSIKTGLMQDLLTGRRRVTPLLAAKAELAAQA